MKQLTMLLAGIVFCTSVFAQSDTAISTKSDTTINGKKSDTLRIGNIIIIKNGGKKPEGNNSGTGNTMGNSYHPKKYSRVTTNWGVLDFGFTNYNDQTNYTTAVADGYLVNKPGSPAFSKDDLKLNSGKSVNVNIWFFMQRLSIIKQNVNLKYGLGLELNNYHYRSNISYKQNGTIPYSGGVQTNAPFIFKDSISFSKNKLAADYLTVPIMLNFATNNANNRRGISVSFGVSAGYLYSQRNKQISNERGKLKNKGDYNLEKFKFSYIGELGLGPVKLYASYTPKSIYENSLDIKPYNFGIRLSY